MRTWVRLTAAVLAVATVTSCSSDLHRAPAGDHPPTQSPTTRTPAPAVATTVVAPAAATTSAAPAPSGPASSVPATNPCASNTVAQLIRVSVRRQHLWMCAGHRLVRDTPVTTGIPGEDTHTPTGTYTVQARTRNTTLSLIDGRSFAVKYWIPFDAPLFGFHDASWQTFPYGSQKYRTDGSHGCVHMPVAAIAFLYRWAQVGARVRIR